MLLSTEIPNFNPVKHANTTTDSQYSLRTIPTNVVLRILLLGQF